MAFIEALDDPNVHNVRVYYGLAAYVLVGISLVLVGLQLWQNKRSQRVAWARRRHGKHETSASVGQLHIYMHDLNAVMALSQAIGAIDRFNIWGLRPNLWLDLSIYGSYEASFLLLTAIVLISYYYTKGLAADILHEEPIWLKRGLFVLAIGFLLIQNAFLVLAFALDSMTWHFLIIYIQSAEALLLAIVVAYTTEYLAEKMLARFKGRGKAGKGGQRGSLPSVELADPTAAIRSFRRSGRRRAGITAFVALFAIAVGALEHNSGEFWVYEDSKMRDEFDPAMIYWLMMGGLFVSIAWFWIPMQSYGDEIRTLSTSADGAKSPTGAPLSAADRKRLGLASPRKSSRASTSGPELVRQTSATTTTISEESTFSGDTFSGDSLA